MADHRVFAAVYDRLPASAEKGGLRQMRSDLLREARAVEIVDAPAEQLPSTTAASTRSYPRSCCVHHPERAAPEVRRVLRPDGALLYLEHVRSPDRTGLARWQARVERPWGWFAAGCHLNRPTYETLPEAGFEVKRLGWHTFPKSGMTPWVRPLISGSASPG